MKNRPIRHLRTGKPAIWLTHEQTYLNHASVDGSSALCGVKSKYLKPNPRRSELSWQPDPAVDYMTCDRCKELVRYAKKHEIESETHALLRN